MRRGVGGLLAGLVALLLCGASSAGERPMEEEALTNLRATISKLRKDLNRTRDRYDQIRSELRMTEERIGALSKGLRGFDTKIREQHRRLNELQFKKEALDASVAHQRVYLAQQVRAAYVMGQQEYLRLLLNQENPATVGRVMAYYDYFNRARAQRIGSLQETLTSLEILRVTLEKQAARLESLRRARVLEKKKYEEVRNQRAHLLASLKGEIRSKDKHLDELIADAHDLESVLVTLRRAAAKRQPDHRPSPDQPNSRSFPKMRGKLPWPTPGPLQVRFGAQRAQGKLQWEGVLIRASQGQEVRAVSQGRVMFADWLRGYGLLIVIDHGDGYMTLYAHNQSLFKETGDWVEAKDVIAAVGDSGGQEAEALYFEIRHNGQPVDPVTWCGGSHG